MLTVIQWADVYLFCFRSLDEFNGEKKANIQVQEYWVDMSVFWRPYNSS